jgi:hypothetical protein
MVLDAAKWLGSTSRSRLAPLSLVAGSDTESDVWIGAWLRRSEQQTVRGYDVRRRRLRWPVRPPPASGARLRLRQTMSRSWTRRATTSTPAILGVRPPTQPPRFTTSPRSDPADAGTQGHRTPDIGHLDGWTPANRTPDTGHVDRHASTLDARTELCTADDGRGCGQSDDGTVGIRSVLGHHTERSQAGMPNRVSVDGACGARQPSRLVRKATCRRETASRATRQDSVTSPIKARLGALLSSE